MKIREESMDKIFGFCAYTKGELYIYIYILYSYNVMDQGRG